MQRLTFPNDRFKTLGQYALVVVLCVLILTWVMQLWRADFNVPFTYSGDSLLYGIAAKGAIEHGWWFHNDSLGAPAGLHYEAYPAIENFHLAVIKLISIFSSNYAFVLNLFYLLTFPFTAVTSFYVFRTLRFSFAVSLVTSLLYAFLPYHFFRSYHLFLAAYYLVPLMVLVILWVCQDERFEWKSRKGLFSVVVCVSVGCCGVYYPFFSCFLLMIAGLTAAWNRRSMSPIVPALILTGLVAGTVAINHLPTAIYQRTHGSAAMGARSVADAEIMGLKITQLLLPIGGHRLEKFAALRYRYNLGPLVNENDTTSLGAVGSVGFLFLIASLFYRRKLPDVIERLSILNIACFLLATIGGFGVLFALLVTTKIRAYNRIAVFIAFFSLLAVAWLLDELFKVLANRGLQLVSYLGLAVILVVGVLDQTSTIFFFVPEYEKIRNEYQSDAEFVNRIEASVPQRAMIFQLPYMSFPESPPVQQMLDHENLKAYLHSNTLRWSYGATAGESEDNWQRTVAGQAVPELVNNLRAAGFDGIYINRNGYEDRGAKLENELKSVLRSSPIVNRAGTLAFYKVE